MPAYKYQISVEDRWAIIAYLRVLQRAGHSTMEDVPGRPADGIAMSLTDTHSHAHTHEHGSSYQMEASRWSPPDATP